MQVIAHAVDERLVQRVLARGRVDAFGVLAYVRAHAIFFLPVEQRGHFAGVEDVVDVLHEPLLDDLRVREEEHGRYAVDARLLVQVLEVVPELLRPVPAAQLDGEALEPGDERREPRQALLPGAAHAHQHRVPARLPQDARDARRVLGGVHEKHQVHRVRGVGVVLLEVLLHQQHHLLHVRDFLVHALFLGLCAAAQKVPEQNRAVHEQVLERRRVGKVFLHDLRHHVLVVVLVLHRDEPVVEHAHGLVHPQARHDVPGLTLIRGDEQHALQHLGQVAQVERVVRLGGRRQELLGHAAVHLHRRVNHGLDALREVAREPARDRQEPAVDAAQDGLHARVGRWRDVQHVEVPEEARRHLLPPAAGRRARTNQRGVLDVLPEELLAVVEAPEVLELPQELDGRLRAVRLARGHVDVVHEEHDLFVRGRAELGLAFFLQLRLDQELRVVRRGLRREVDHHRHQVLLLGVLREVIHDDHALAHARPAGQKQALVHLEAPLEQKRKPRRVDVGDEQLEVRRLGVVGKLLHQVVPGREPPFGLLGVGRDHVVVVQRVFVREVPEPVHVRVQKLARPLVEAIVELRVDVPAHAPDVRKRKEFRQTRLELFLVLHRQVHAALGARERLEQARQTSHQINVHGGDALLQVLPQKLQTGVDGFIE